MTYVAEFVLKLWTNDCLFAHSYGYLHLKHRFYAHVSGSACATPDNKYVKQQLNFSGIFLLYLTFKLRTSSFDPLDLILRSPTYISPRCTLDFSLVIPDRKAAVHSAVVSKATCSFGTYLAFS